MTVVDFRLMDAPSTGPRLHTDLPERGVKVDNWCIHRRWIEHETGGYWDFCDFPLQDADEETVAHWPMPDPKQYNYTVVYDTCARMQDYAVCLNCYCDRHV